MLCGPDERVLCHIGLLWSVNVKTAHHDDVLKGGNVARIEHHQDGIMDDAFLPMIEKPNGLMMTLAYYFTRRQFGTVLAGRLGRALRRLKEHLDESQLVELTHVIALEMMRGRFNLALAIGAAGGFRQGLVCAVPELANRRSAKEAGDDHLSTPSGSCPQPRYGAAISHRG